MRTGAPALNARGPESLVQERCGEGGSLPLAYESPYVTVRV